VILAGGASRRFGADKARHVWRGRALIEHVRQAVATVCDPVLVVGGAGADLPDDTPGAGPLAALATAFGHLPDDEIFLTACDLPLLTPPVVAAVVQAELLGADAAVARTPDGRAQPLVARYHRRCLDALGRVRDQSLRGMLRHVQVVWIDPPGDPGWALNVNRVDDLPDPVKDPGRP